MGYFKNKAIQDAQDARDLSNEDLIPENWQELQSIDYAERQEDLRMKQHAARQELQLAMLEIQSVLNLHPSVTLETALTRIKVVYESMWQGTLFHTRNDTPNITE